jgi:gas vesicle protein
MDSRGTTKSFLIGMLTGAAAGGLAALLYAPKSGREMRKDIGKQKDRLIKEGERQMNLAKGKVADIIESSRKKAENIMNDAKNKYENLKSSTTDLISSGKERLAEEKDKISEAVKSGVEAYREERKSSPKH